MQRTAHCLLYLLLVGCLIGNSYAETPFEHEETQSLIQSPIEKLYEEGEEAMRREKWDEALRKLQLLNIRYPSNAHLEQAELSIIFCYTRKKEYTRALISVNAFICDHPQSKWLESALQMRTDIEKQSASSSWGWEVIGKAIVTIIGIQLLLNLLATSHV